MSAERPPEEGPPRVKGRLPFDVDASKGAFQRASLVFYGVLTIGLIGLALYMALAEGHALTSAFVAAPAIGAIWFALRLFMIWGSRG